MLLIGFLFALSDSGLGLGHASGMTTVTFTYVGPTIGTVLPCALSSVEGGGLGGVCFSIPSNVSSLDFVVEDVHSSEGEIGGWYRFRNWAGAISSYKAFCGSARDIRVDRPEPRTEELFMDVANDLAYGVAACLEATAVPTSGTIRLQYGGP